MCFVNIYIQYMADIALQNTDFGVFQKSSKHFLISIFFPSGEMDTPSPSMSHPRSPFCASNKGFVIVYDNSRPPPPPPPPPKSWMRNCMCEYIWTLSKGHIRGYTLTFSFGFGTRYNCITILTLNNHIIYR